MTHVQKYLVVRKSTVGLVEGILISVRLWNFKDGGSLKARVLDKNQYTLRKKLYFENTEKSNIGHDFS